ncbi:hypothetical protein C3420_16065, partial [Acinetobacter sp. ACNIH3]|uniref:BapA/Bap/LapF family large adhesin n=1 Tax=Acinetobacter sp. ACNIH3 TaxID=1985874 RepID=UPI000D4BE2A4
AGNESDSVTAVADTATDTTAPEVPVIEGFDGTTVVGTAEPGSTITISSTTGRVLANGTVDVDGKFSIILPISVSDAVEVQVTATDAAGNESDFVTAVADTATDTTAPEVPVIEGFDGTTVIGTAEPDSTITVRDAAGNELATATADEEGNFSVVLEPAVEDGAEVEVTATDAAGNESDFVTAVADTATDTTAPEVPVIEGFDGTTVVGTAEPGSTIIVSDTEGNELATATADEEGNFSVVLEPAVEDGAEVEVTATDAAGNESDSVTAVADTATDTTAPEVPVIEGFDGTTVVGTAEPGSTIIVSDTEGNELATAIADEEGNFSVGLEPAVENGTEVEVTATDAADNESAPATAVADTIAPEIPVIEGFDGTTVVGTAEPGSTITVRDTEGNELATGTADEEGNFSVVLEPAVENGTEVEVTATDAAGNESDSVTAVADTATDTTAPEVPVIEGFDGTTVVGTAEPGSTITVRDAAGNELATATADEEGNFSVVLEPAVEDGAEVEVTATDAAGNESASVTAVADTATDTTAPEVPVIEGFDGTTVVGTAEPGSTIIVSDTEGNELATATADEEGNFSVVLEPAIDDGAEVEVTATDAAGNESASVTAVADTATDTTAPEVPVIEGFDGTTVVGTAEPGSTITIRDAAGEVLATGTADEEGNFSVVLEPAIEDGAEVEVTATDAAGNESDPATAIADMNTDTTAPAVPDIQGFDGTTVVGTAEPGSTITIRDAAGEVLATGTADEDGNFRVVLEQPVEDEAEVEVTATDAAGNESDPVTATADTNTDTTAPAVPDIQGFDGTTVVGTAEPGSTITIRDAEGVLITGTADDIEGSFSITLPTPVENGTEVEVTATDAAGNESAPAIAIADTIAPEVPEIEGFDGTTVVGTAEPGSTITIRNAAGEVLATGTADEDGNFSVVLEPAVENGTEVEVTATDAAGNESDSVTAVADTATDTTAPEVPVIEDFDGTTVVGTAEPGSTITVRDAAGNELATDTADEEGNFIIELENPFSNGEELNIVATDTSGNESTPVSINAPDITPPIIESIAIADGLGSITVVTEPNANVVLTDAEGNELASGQAGENGVYIYTPNAPFADGALINVVVSDAAGNNTTEEIRAGIAEVVAAADNNVQLILDILPSQAVNPNPSSLNSTGFTVGAVGLGPVLNVSALESVFSSSVDISVAEGTTRDLTFYADAGGLTAGSMDLFMYKRNATTGEWELRESLENWYTVVVGGVSPTITRNFDEGEWLLVLGNGEGLSLVTGYTMRFTGDVVNDFNNPIAITGTSAGNVITDTDYQNGTDQVPEGSLITSVNGTTLNAAGMTTIQGQHGTLSIQQDGTYSYSANANFREYGETDSFSYVITAPDGTTASAELNIELVRIPSNEDVIIDDTVTLTVQPLETVLTGNQITIENATAINLLNLGVAGNVLSASVIGTEGVMDFTVGAGTLRELTFQGSGGGLSVAVTYGFTIYRQDEETGLFVQVYQEPSFLYVPFLASGRSDPLTLSFGEGTYIAIIAATGGVDLAGGASVEVTVDKTYDYNAPVQLNGTTSGDVTADDTVQLVEVNDQIVQEGTATTVVGQFGTLVINFDGTYTYSVTKPADTTGWQPPYGEIERFELVKQAADGKSFIDILNIAIQTHEAVDDFESIVIDSRNSSERTFTADESLLNENNVAINFELTDYQYAETLTLNASVTRTSLASTPTATILITKDGETVYQGPIAVTWGRGIGQAAYNGKISAPITLPEDTDFTAGEYTVIINLNGNLTNIRNITSAELTGNIINDISFNGEPVEAIIGNILQDNDQANDQIDILKIGRQELYVNDLTKGASSFTVQGQHGVLTLNKDGSYSYQPSGESAGIETFTYTTISKVGTEQTATLEISVGMNLTGSDLDEQVVASDAEDVFTLGGGADTVIYEVLNAGQDEGTADIWTDFSLTEGDAIDVSALLTGANAENISEYISVEVNDNNATVISIDRDGAGTQFQDKVELITLEGVNTNLEELLSNGHIIY